MVELVVAGEPGKSDVEVSVMLADGWGWVVLFDWVVVAFKLVALDQLTKSSSTMSGNLFWFVF